jgi:flagellar protein FlaJ
MKIGIYQKLCYKFFGGIARGFAAKRYKLREDLVKSRIPLLPESYVAYALGTTGLGILVAVALLYPLSQLVSALALPTTAKLALTVLVYLLPLLVGVGIYVYFMARPSALAKSRARDIDAHLPYAANFIAAMSAAHATPDVIFRSLGTQESIYGEVSKEAAWVYRDMRVLGMDLLTALKEAVARSPSAKYQDFLQGMIGTLTSGGELKSYFLNRAEHYMRENRREQRDFIETLGVLGESYMVVAVAAPLLIIIMMVVMSWIGGGVPAQLLLPLIVFGVLPVIHLGYAVVIKLSAPKV